MTHIPEKISALVKDRLPEFIKADYQTFVAFIEAYYSFLEQNGNPRDAIRGHLQYRDIDNTLDDFIKYFKSQYAINIPESILADKRLLYKHLKELYTTKGTEASFKLLFRILFNKDIEISYPSTQILRASDGRWKQEISVFVEVVKGNINDIVGQYVTTNSLYGSVGGYVDYYKEVIVDGVVSDTVYEVLLERKKFLNNVHVNDRIRIGETFDSVVLPTISKVKIQQSGKNFKAGEVYRILSGSGTNALLKVKKTDKWGGIVECELIKFGPGYITDFSATIVPYFYSTTESNIGNITIDGGNIGISETYAGFIESGEVNYYDYNIDTIAPAISGSYAGELAAQFYTDNTRPTLDVNIPAIISFSVGAVAKYPGYFSTNDGFLDDAIFIQDGYYYQPFSYVITVDEKLSEYKKAVKNLIHPAGMALFGNYEILNSFDVSPDLVSASQYISLLFKEEILTEESTYFSMVKALNDAFTLSDTLSKGVTKALSDSISTPTDFAALTVTKAFVDSIDSPTDSANLGLTKNITDSVGIADQITDKYITKALSDSVSVIDFASVTLNKYISAGLDDIATPIDSGGFIIFNPYAEAGYFLEQYVGTPISF